MQLKNLTNELLVSNIKSLVLEERKLTNQVLHHLREIERRMLYSMAGYSSLHAYCVGELHYSDGAAHRRISAMRLIQEMPEVEAMVEKGSLNLTTASQIQDFFKAEQKSIINKPLQTISFSREEKRELITQIQNKSKTEVEKVLIGLSPQNVSLSINRDRQRVITENKTEFKIILNAEQIKKLKRFQELTSHRNTDPNKISDFIEHALDIALKQIDPLQKKVAACKTVQGKKLAHEEIVTSLEKLQSNPLLNSPTEGASTRYIKPIVKQTLYNQAQGQCQYMDPKTKKRCESRSFLEIDHCLPLALGGTNDIRNLRLLCRNHNQLMAIQSYGREKMNRYLECEYRNSISWMGSKL